MFEIKRNENGTISLHGRLDASQVDKARAVFSQVTESCEVDFAELSYISSAGLGILLKTQKRLVESGPGLKIINVNNHIHDVFRYSGFHSIFEIEAQ